MTNSDEYRFHDDGARLVSYSDLIYVTCPHCDARATVTVRPGHQAQPVPPAQPSPPAQPAPHLNPGALYFLPRRLACDRCGLTRDWRSDSPRPNPPAALLGAPVDPFFRLPLWLQTPCKGETLWAYNERQLDIIERYVTARLRQRPASSASSDPAPTSMAERLPRWIKAAKNRDDVLRAIERLRAKNVST